jgi:RNA polymerase sigma-70 factor, ECF subfamily
MKTSPAGTPGAGAEEHADLVRAAQAGDRDAYGELYRHFARLVHAVLLARLPRAQVDDLVQDVFLHAMTKLRELREPAAFGGWICTLARRRAADHYRRSTPEAALAETVDPASSPETAAEAAAAVAAIQELPDAYRETLALRLVAGMSGPEIAAATGLTPESVRVNLHRGFRLLRSRLGVTS